MEVPDWLLKPTENNKDHIKLLAQIEHVQKAAERRGIDPFLSNQINRLSKEFWEHAKRTCDLEPNPVAETLEKNPRKTLIIGGIVAAVILVPFGLLTKTNLLHPRPTDCWEMQSKEEKKPVKVCLLTIDHPYNPSNGDVSVVLSLPDGKDDTVISAEFWIADEIGNREVDYKGEYNITRTRVYSRNMLVRDDRSEWSSWVKPGVPRDLVMPLWNKIKEKERDLNYSRPLLEDQINRIVEGTGALLAGVGSIIYTLWKFYTEREG
jgi:hypothetical protein